MLNQLTHTQQRNQQQLKDTAEPPDRSASLRYPINYNRKHRNYLQRFLPSLPSVTNYRANGLGLYGCSSSFRFLLLYALLNSRHLQGTTYVYVRPITVFVKPSQINSLAL